MDVFNNIGIEDVHGKREMPVLVDYGAEDEGARRIVHAAGTAESPWGEDAVVSVFVRFVEQCAKGAAEDVGGFAAWCKKETSAVAVKENSTGYTLQGQVKPLQDHSHSEHGAAAFQCGRVAHRVGGCGLCCGPGCGRAGCSQGGSTARRPRLTGAAQPKNPGGFGGTALGMAVAIGLIVWALLSSGR